MKIEVVYAAVNQQALITLDLASGCTALEAITQSGILTQFPEINLEHHPIGVFSRKVSFDYVLADNDRVEIYRPLTIDPKDARMARVKAERKRLRK